MGERVDAVPECPKHPEIPQAAVDAAIAYAAHPVDDDGHTDCYYRGLLAAAAPLLPGGGEAERLRQRLKITADWVEGATWLMDQRDVKHELREAVRLARDAVGPARPDAGRAPQEEGAALPGHDGVGDREAEEGRGVAQGRAEPNRASSPPVASPRPPRPQGDEVETACPQCGRSREDVRDGEGCGDYERCPGSMAALDARSGADRPEGER